MSRVHSYLVFLLVTACVGLPLLYRNLDALLSLVVPQSYEQGASTVSHASELGEGVYAFLQHQPLRAITDTQPSLFVVLLFLLSVYVVSLLWKQGRESLRRVFPFLLLVVWYWIYLKLFAHGISI